jgi:hypothetical protein
MNKGFFEIVPDNYIICLKTQHNITYTFNMGYLQLHLKLYQQLASLLNHQSNNE